MRLGDSGSQKAEDFRSRTLVSLSRAAKDGSCHEPPPPQRVLNRYLEDYEVVTAEPSGGADKLSGSLTLSEIEFSQPNL